MVMAVERSDDEVARAYLLAVPAAQVSTETGATVDAVYRWLRRERSPRGLYRTALIARARAWERELAAARAMPVRKKALPPEPPKRWAQ